MVDPTYYYLLCSWNKLQNFQYIHIVDTSLLKNVLFAMNLIGIGLVSPSMCSLNKDAWLIIVDIQHRRE